MIQITAYLRTEEDLKRWKAVKNKSEFLQRALNHEYSGIFVSNSLHEAVIEPIKRVHVSQQPPITQPVITERFSGPLCKIHGLPLDTRGKCLQKGCKYS